MWSREVIDAVTLCTVSHALRAVPVEVSIHCVRTRPPRPCQPLSARRDLTGCSSIMCAYPAEFFTRGERTREDSRTRDLEACSTH